MWGVLITAKRRYYIKCTETTAREPKPLLPNSQMIPSYCTAELIWPRTHAVVRYPEQGQLATSGFSFSEHEYYLFATCLSMFWTGASLPLQLVLRLRWCGWCGYLLLIWLLNYLYSFFFLFSQIEETNKQAEYYWKFSEITKIIWYEAVQDSRKTKKPG